jgi:hypothetical protein
MTHLGSMMQELFFTSCMPNTSSSCFQPTTNKFCCFWMDTDLAGQFLHSTYCCKTRFTPSFLHHILHLVPTQRLQNQQMLPLVPGTISHESARRDEEGSPNVACFNEIFTVGWKRFSEEERLEVRRLGYKLLQAWVRNSAFASALPATWPQWLP